MTLAVGSTLAFTVRTRAANAMLLHQTTSGADASTLAFFIVDGRVQAQLALADQPPLTLVSESAAYNDGRAHQITLARTAAQVLVRIDDREILTGALNDARAIGAADATLQIGGFAPDASTTSAVDLAQEPPTRESLVGCLADVYHDYQ